MTPKVVLIGLPGTGKSTTGRRLAKILAVPFADSDELVEAATGRTVQEFFADSGEPAFRAAEAAAIIAAIGEFPGVLALGGGSLGSADTRAALTAAGATVVLLHAELDTLAQRVGDGATRPLLSGDPAGPARRARGGARTALPAGRHVQRRHRRPHARSRRGHDRRARARARGARWLTPPASRSAGRRPTPSWWGSTCSASCAPLLAGAAQVAVIHPAPLRRGRRGRPRTI